MPWTRLDDQFHTNPKVTSLPDTAFRMYVNGLVWSVANLTDGRIPFVNASQTLSKPHGNSVRNAIRYLVETGLWTPDTDEKDVWWVHDFDQYQPTKSQVEQEREANRRRVAKHRDRRGNGVTEPLRNGITEEDVTALVIPPHPIPDKNSPLSSLTHTLTDLLNGPKAKEDEMEDWTQPPEGADPALWANAVDITWNVKAAGTKIYHPHRYAEAIYEQLTATATNIAAEGEANTQAAELITNCTRCDPNGWTLNTDGDITIPTIRCNHLHAVEEAEA